MKKIFLKVFSVLLGIAMLTSCGDFDNINDDPNKPNQAYTENLFAYALNRVTFFTMEQSYNPTFLLFPKYIAERQNVQYGKLDNNGFKTRDYYRYNLKNLKTIIDMNEDPAKKGTVAVTSFGSNANQIAAAKTLMDYYYLHLTDILGMIPYSEALKGADGILTPKLDDQQSVYKALVADLKAAYDLFDESSSLNSTYEYIYEGDIAKWKKLNASLRMLAAIKLADVDPETGKAWFKEAYADGGIVDNADNFTYKFLQTSDNENPLYTNIVTEGRNDFCPSEDLVDNMNTLSDPRRVAYFTKNKDGVYKGIPQGIEPADVSKYNKDNSGFNSSLYAQNAPFVIISAARVLLVEAEAAQRGWINADAKSLYEQGIATSIKAKFSLVSQATPDDAEIAAYIAQDGVAYSGTDADKIKLIALQRWIAGFFEDGVEAWADWRRLGYPVLVPGPKAVVTHIPYRMIYSSDDVSTNAANYKAAQEVQGENDTDTRVWWDVADND
ncbi:MAG: SusD/RagB family nutrient-binding outer membrane lipoprotein [Prevotella sp.]|nr:SusD/RagB family nutrient-binding outer membrane lipoprotein [Prevotella sp.]